jgi:hypothetical protein
LLLRCVYNREVWFLMLSKLGYQLPLAIEEAAASWWLREQSRVVKTRRPAFDSLVLGVFDCTGTIFFRGAALSPVSLAQQLEQLLLD